MLGLPLETGSRSDYSHPTHLPRKIPGSVGCGGRTLSVLPPLEKARSGWVRCMFPLVDNPHSISLHAKLDKIVRGASVFFPSKQNYPHIFLSLSLPKFGRANFGLPRCSSECGFPPFLTSPSFFLHPPQYGIFVLPPLHNEQKWSPRFSCVL